MKIKNITYVETNETRTDGRYPIRIGSEVNFAFYEPTIGNVMYLDCHLVQPKDIIQPLLIIRYI